MASVPDAVGWYGSSDEMIWVGAMVTRAAVIRSAGCNCLNDEGQTLRGRDRDVDLGSVPAGLGGAVGAMIGIRVTVLEAAVMWIGRCSHLGGEGQTLRGRDRDADLGSVPGGLGGAVGAMIGIEATVSGAAVMWIGGCSYLDG